MMAFRGWSDGVADVTAEVTTVKTPSLARRAESRGSRRPSFVSMPRAPRLRASWSATRGGSFPFAHQLGLKISEALSMLEGRGKRTGREREHPNRVSQRSPRAFPEAGAMGATATFGRVLFAFVFIASALNKLSSLAEGGEMLDSVSPRLAVARRALARKVGIDPLFFAGDGSLVLVATLMELAGAALFVADFALGAKLLMLFILLVTPIMHPFWAAYPDAHTERAVDMIMFFKNASLFGALLVYLEMKPTLEAMKPKSKRR
jgi:hypothetical protein